MQVLLVEDNASLAEALVVAIRHAGFSINHVSRGESALTALRTSDPDIIILDLGLPDMDGLDVLKACRRNGFMKPVLILTARDGVSHRVKGLDSGADDYLAKPFETEELLARLRALERRHGNVKSSVIEVGPVSLDAGSFEVKVDGKELILSRREFMLLKALMENANKVQTREMLDSKLYSWGEEVSSNALEVHVHHLRKKLPDGYIQTVRGLGYVIKQ